MNPELTKEQQNEGLGLWAEGQGFWLRYKIMGSLKAKREDYDPMVVEWQDIKARWEAWEKKTDFKL